MTNWNRDGRYHGGFPPTVHRQARRTLPMRCAQCGTDTVPLKLDHIVNKASNPHAPWIDTIQNAQWLCDPCHDAKTKTEAAAGRRARHARRHRPTPRHPGLI